MPDFFKTRWPLLFVLIVFIISKIPALHYPFFWDESWSYAPGVRLMYDHGPSLMPNAINTDFSRGHPLLFYAAAAAWMKLFGISHIAQHCFGLFISCLTLIAVHETCLRLFNRRMAVIALLLVVTQLIFFVQSTLLLPEIMVALLALLSIYYYAQRKYMSTFLSLSALMLTKESGATIGLVLGIHALWSLPDKSTPVGQKLKNLLSVTGAGVVIVIFFLVQKKLNCWYLYPEHMSYINADWEMYKGKLRFCTEIIFRHQYRYIFFSFIALLSLRASVSRKDFRLALPLAVYILLFISSNEYMGYITRRLLLPFILTVIIYTFYQATRLQNNSKQQSNFILLSVFAFVTYVSFCCINFFTDRYLLTALIIALVISAYLADMFIDKLRSFVYPLTIVITLAIAAVSFTNSHGIGDVGLQMYKAMEVQQAVVDYMENNNLYEHNIAAPSSLNRVHLTQPYTGFLRSGKTFKSVNYTMEPTTEYLIIDNIEPDTSIHKSQLEQQFTKAYSVAKGEAWAEIYKRK
jgi:4-amino-4-deoxy-L-arabinose transferase-like glycosyltransferase